MPDQAVNTDYLGQVSDISTVIGHGLEHAVFPHDLDLAINLLSDVNFSAKFTKSYVDGTLKDFAQDYIVDVATNTAADIAIMSVVRTFGTTCGVD